MNLQWLFDAFEDAAKGVRERAVFRVRTYLHELDHLRTERKAFDAKLDALKAQLEQSRIVSTSYQTALQNAIKERDRALSLLERSFRAMPFNHWEPYETSSKFMRMTIQLPCPPLANVHDYLSNKGWKAAKHSSECVVFNHDNHSGIILPPADAESFQVDYVSSCIDVLMRFEKRSNLDIYRDIMETFT